VLLVLILYELFIYAIPPNSVVGIFGGWVNGWSSSTVIKGCAKLLSLAQVYFWFEVHHHWSAVAAIYLTLLHVKINFSTYFSFNCGFYVTNLPVIMVILQ